jgi:UPF0755 protein
MNRPLLYRRLRIAVALLFVLLTVSIAVVGMIYWRWATQAPRPGEKTTTRLTVAPDASVQSVGRELEAKGIIRSWRVFMYLGRESRIQPGIYDFAPSEPPRTILGRLAKGDVVTTKVTFPEGFTLRRMAARLKDRGLIAAESLFLGVTADKGNTLKAPFPLPDNLEGYLFPDTYQFPLGASETAIAQRMLDNFTKRVVEGKDLELKASGRPLAEIVNVAAMVEREAQVDEDRPKIAGVIYNRLAKGMRLQIDATVQYARGVHESRLLYRHLEVDSPYNTYKHAGLPPGPICNPGLPSLEAAMLPAKHEYLFYVLGPNRKHLFAKTFAEHQRNIALSRRLARQAKNP